ncbi:DUF373 family protein [Thermococcus barophilus]|uniref:DUF373 family protein n=1 Tax=Thermococcus barophilus (strain DSM 11836 / MP) TaxID=391623 RepID=F0LJ71_THEBM|nr:DUF373 family protein [Thermococcus barophilus]ADT84593.1 hypothetical protein TERMP_01618 [Thermococcus barophilus MP]
MAIDRDDDFGVKAGVKGPVIGRDACIDAALKLSLADPEDSDANVVYAAVKLHDELKESGEFEDVKVALITGHHDVGVKSDLELSKQLDEVLKVFPADGIIPVTDGAEDEQIFPIITSKVPIISSRRVVVKQSESIETTYYIIYRYLKEILSEPEVAKVVFGLTGLVMLLYGVAKLISVKYPQSVQIVSATVTGTILFIIGTYLFSKGFRIHVSLRETITKGFIEFISVIAGMLVMVAGAINAYLNLEYIAMEKLGGLPGTQLIAVLLYLNILKTPFVVGLGVMVLGKVLQSYLRKDPHIWYYITGLLLLPALWITIDLTTLYAMSTVSPYLLQFFKKIVMAIGDVVVGTLIGIYLREKVKGWEKIEIGKSPEGV